MREAEPALTAAVAFPWAASAGDLRDNGFMTARARLPEIVRRLRAAYEPERIYLFGSAARGDGGPDSDLDLLVVVPDEAAPARKRSRLGYEALRGTGTAVDLLVMTSSYFERRRHLRASLPGTVLREGTVLHE